ncbi:sulfatase [Maribacter sp. 2307ULW6-5]|uniref:sulfatase family protein n=1 Tax=Maribacter sp. 2307ULW6-5 TaxID=3386275 RepID=UPI0039BC3E14
MKKVGITIVMLLLAVGLLIGCSSKERSDAHKRPNILIAMMDDASFPHVGINGCTWVETPNFDRIAQEGILFSNAYTPNAKCAPSRSSFLTGRNSWQLEEAANHWCYFPEKFKSFFESLADNGYHTGFTGKGWAPGVATINGKPRFLTGTPFNDKQTEVPTTGISKTDYAANFENFLNQKTEEEPFSFWFGSKEPHRDYEYGSGIAKGKKKLAQIDSVYAHWPDIDSVRTDLLDYAFEIEYFDKQLGNMLRLLEEKGELDNTLIIVTADNGMPFPRIKGQEYELSNHMPLTMMWKNGIEQPNRKVDDMVSFIDLAPTLLEIAEIAIEKSGMMPMEGKSLTDIFRSNDQGVIDPARDHVLIGKERHDVGRPDDVGYPIRGIVKGDYLFVENFETDRWPAGNPSTGYLNCDGSPTKTTLLHLKDRSEDSPLWELNFGKRPPFELYNIKEDILCMNNLAHQSGYQTMVNELRTQMWDQLRAQNDPRILGHGEVFDHYEYADTSGVNFYERYWNGEELNSSWVSPTDFDRVKEEVLPKKNQKSNSD